MSLMKLRPLLRINNLIASSTYKQSYRLNSATTVDENEIKQHAAMAQDWWDLKGKMSGLHHMNELRIPFIRDGILTTMQVQLIDETKPLKDFSILDVGCGGGILSEPLARIGAKVTGLDASAELISVAKEHMKQDPKLANNLVYMHSSVEEHADNNKEIYDAVVLSEIIEHITEKDLFIQKCLHLLKPGGSIFVTTLNKTYLSLVGGIFVAEYILCLVPKGTHQWDKFISPLDLQKLLCKYGCTTKVIHGMSYNLITKKFSWSNQQQINYALHAVKNVDK